MKFARFKYNFRYGPQFRKPKLNFRIAKNFFDHLILRKQPLRYIDVNVGLFCNLKCQYCFSENLKHKGATSLSLEEMKDVIQQSIQLGVIIKKIFLCLTGIPLHE